MNRLSHVILSVTQPLACGFFLLLPLLLLAGCDDANSSDNAAPTPKNSASGGSRMDRDSAFFKQLGVYEQPEFDRWDPGSDADIQCFFKGTPEVDLKVGFKMRDGTIISPARFDDCNTFNEGMAPVKLGKKWGFLDRKGVMAIELRFDEARNFYEGRAAVRIGDKWGFVDPTGKMVIKLRFKKKPLGFREGRVAVVIDKKIGFIDRDGKLVAAAKYDEVFGCAFMNGLAPVARAGKWGFIDRSGKEAVPLVYESVEWFSEGLAAVQLKGKWGFVDSKGKIVIEPEYDKVYRFAAGRAAVVIGGQGTVIDRSGKRLAPSTPYHNNEPTPDNPTVTIPPNQLPKP